MIKRLKLLAPSADTKDNETSKMNISTVEPIF